MTKLADVKAYRQARDELFADLSKCEHGTDAYNTIRSKIYDLDEQNEHLIDESVQPDGMVHAESFNFGDIKRQFQHIPQDLGIDPHQIVDAIRGELQHVLTEAAGPIAKVAFKKSAEYAKKTYDTLTSWKANHSELVSAIDTLGISVSLSVVTLHYDGFYGRAEGLTRLLSEQADHFQFNRHSIRWIIKNTGPKSVDINLSGELFTSAFSAGVGVHGEIDLLVALVDEALAHMGIPE